MATAIDNGVSYTLRNGTSKADKITGGLGNDWIVSGAGNDTIVDLLGRNIFDAGAGSDTAAGGLFNDFYIHRIGENVGFVDRYDGSTGRDTLRLELTTAEWAQANVQADIAAFQTHVNSVPNKLLGILGLTSSFQFSSTNLRVTNIEALEVRVGGQTMNLADEAVRANADTLTNNEDASRSINLLTNDTAPDRVASIQLIGTSTLGSLTLDKSLQTLTQSAILSFTPSVDLQAMTQGETRTEVISYKITDVDGDVSTANVTITVEGRNDAPVARGDQATTDEDTPVTIDVLANDTDVDAGDTLTITAASVKDGLGSVAIVDGKLVYNPGSAYDDLTDGDVAAVTIVYSVDDKNGGTSTAEVIVAVAGKINEPTYDTVWTGDDEGNHKQGTLGNDYLDGRDGNDFLSGDYSSLIESGNVGNVTHYFGNDTVIGGSGSNALVGDVADFFLDDVVSSHLIYRMGDDLIDETSGDGFGTLLGDINSIFATNSATTTIEMHFGNDVLHGGGVYNSISGDAAWLSSTGLMAGDFQGGNDELYGAAFEDTIAGDAISLDFSSTFTFRGGDDVLVGGGGDDRLSGDFDYIYGNGNVSGGDDTFVFGVDSGNDLVTDFGFGADKLDISAYGITEFSDLHFTLSGDNTIIDLDGTAANIASITLLNYTALKAADFIFEI